MGLKACPACGAARNSTRGPCPVCGYKPARRPGMGCGGCLFTAVLPFLALSAVAVVAILLTSPG